MRRQVGFAVTALALLVSARPATATASLTCDIDDPIVSVRVLGVIGHAGSVNAISVEGSIKSPGPSATKIKLESDHLVQRWTTGLDVKLRFFRADLNYVIDLTIETRGRKDDEKERPGTYRLEFADSSPGKKPTTVNRNGRANCRIA